MLAIFVALGIGMALPYVLLAWFPGWRRRLPRPGAWIETFKQVLAFPLYATVIWLVWVLGRAARQRRVAASLIALLGVGFALWTWRIARTGGARPWRIAGFAVLAIAAIAAWPLFATRCESSAKAADGGAASADRDWIAVHAGARLGADASGPAGVRRLHRGVVRDLPGQQAPRAVTRTTCGPAFAEKRRRAVRADWTRRDPAITQALAALGRNGVPVYVLYRPGKEPLLLPRSAAAQHDARGARDAVSRGARLANSCRRRYF